MGTKLKNIALVFLGMAAGAIGMGTQLDAIAQRSTTAPLPLEELRQLANVFSIIKSDYVEPVDDKKLLTEAISGMVSSLDPHSVYLDKESFKNLQEASQGKFVGLGIEVSMEDGYVKVVSPIEDSPAYHAGLKAGDLVTRLDSTHVKGMSLDEAVKRMRGEPNTKITLTIARKNEDKPIIVTIIRKEIRVKSVKAKMVEPDYAWLRITQFQERTVDEMVEKITALYKENPNIKGLVLDLRNDPGGILQGAVGVSAAFLPKGAIVTSVNGQLSSSKQTFYARREFYMTRVIGDPLSELPEALKTVPVVVLVNAGSASASEIVAGALQDHKRATIMGKQTFGKGSVQTIRPLSADTALKLTTARYYTPGGRSIQARGIMPDLHVNERPEDDGLNSLRPREADLQKHLLNDRDKNPEVHAKLTDNLEKERKLIEREKKRKPVEFGSKEDFQLTQALNHLKGLPVILSTDKTDKTEEQDKAKDKDEHSKNGVPPQDKK